ncbi:hypothetical protein D3C81_1746350 [compost metagenome]
MGNENGSRVGSIRAESHGERSALTGHTELAAPALIERAIITHESSARAALCDVESVNIVLEIQN